MFFLKIVTCMIKDLSGNTNFVFRSTLPCFILKSFLEQMFKSLNNDQVFWTCVSKIYLDLWCM